MNFAGNKRIYLFTVTILLLLLIVLPIKNHFTNVEAGSNDYQIRMLEITENGNSELTSLKAGLANFTVDTMSMKRFVALRDDLDGRYDAIYIGRGTFSTAQVGNQQPASEENRAKALDTRSVKNDITQLKADEITREFINKGLYVFFHSQTFIDKDNKSQLEQGIIYSSFNRYRNSTVKPNVKFVNDAGLTTIFTDLKRQNSTYINDFQKRPRLQITNRIADFNPNVTNSEIYVPGQKLSFNFNVTPSTQQSAPLSVKLYVGLDKSIKMSDKQLVAQTEISTSSGTIEYILPKTYSGLLYWKLELNDYHNTQLKDFDSGVIRYRGEKTLVNILQVMPDTLTESSLLNPRNMKQSFLDTDDYKLNVSVITMNQFNTYVDNQFRLSNNQSYGLNGTYDMLIFGFVDEYYKKSNLNTNATNAIKQFTGSFKQSVLFTHDTVINLDSNKKNWVNNFKSITGQIDPETNLGHYAANLSTKVKPVNDGLLMQYPFYLSKRDENNKQVDIIQPQIAPTHNQYFTLNLEDPEVVSWYNIESMPNGTRIKNNGDYNQYQRDFEDSWNQYYTYSKGNITYSGTGHFFGVTDIPDHLKVFPEWEQKLFVNTMYRAFIGANHAPEITVHTPTEGASIPSYQNKILIDYTVTDLDFNDRDLTTEVRFKSGNTYFPNIQISNTSIKSGQNMYKAVNNPLPNGGVLDIEIKAWDQNGALTSKTIRVNVLQMNPNLSVTRSLSNNDETDDNTTGKVEQGEPIKINYSVTPKSVPFENVSTDNQKSNIQLISDIVFAETLPPNLEIAKDKLPAGMIVTGNVTSGYTLRHTLSNITYLLKTENGRKIYKPDPNQPITFEITITPTKTQNYVLNDSKLSYVDIHATSPLAVTNEYNSFALQGTSLNGGSIKGPIASGSTINFNNAGIDVNSQFKNTIPYGVVTGGNLSLPEGTVYGNVLVKGTVTNQRHGSIQNGSISYGELLDFSKQESYLKALSDAIANLPSNTLETHEYGRLVVTGDSSINVVEVAASVLSRLDSSELHVPPGSTVIVNVKDDGTEPFLHFPLGNEGGRVLFNFSTTRSDHTLRISQANVYGTILAPRSAINFDGGQVYGILISASMNMGSASLFHHPFVGNLPVEIYPLTNPATTAPSSVNFARTTLSFETLTFTAERWIKALELQDKTIYVGDTDRLIPIVTPADLSDSAFSWTTDSPSTVSVDPSSGDIEGLAVGTAKVTVRAVGNSNATATATITVKDERSDHSLTLTGEDTGTVNTKIPFYADYKTTEISQTSFNWTVTNLDTKTIIENAMTINPDYSTDDRYKNFSVDQSGRYLVSVTVHSTNRDSITATKEILITNPLTELSIIGPKTVVVGGEINLTATRTPANADSSTLDWQFTGANDKNYATLTPSGHTASLKAGDTAKAGLIIKVSSGGIETTHTVNIVELTELYFQDTSISVKVGQTFPLTDILWVIPTSITIGQIRDNLSWISDKPAIASVDNGGEVTGVKKGSTSVKVSYNSGIAGKPPVTATIIIQVTDSTPNGDRY